MSKVKRQPEQVNIPTPTKSRIESNTPKVVSELMFGKKNYMFLLIGAGLMMIGFFLMAGGKMPSPDVWDESIIYSTTRTFIAPVFILAGLVLQFWTIFSKK